MFKTKVLILCLFVAIGIVFLPQPIDSKDWWDCDDLVDFPPYEPCWGSDTLYCPQGPEWFSLCKLKCYSQPIRMLYCNPYGKK